MLAAVAQEKTLPFELLIADIKPAVNAMKEAKKRSHCLNLRVLKYLMDDLHAVRLSAPIKLSPSLRLIRIGSYSNLGL